MNPQSNQAPVNPPTGSGKLVVKVSTARGAIPLSGASVQVRESETGRILYATETGSDGLTEVISLPAPSRTLSQSSGSSTLPFALYHLDVYREGYRKQTYQNVAIFDGITSIQPAVMIPLPDNEREDSYFPEDSQVFEGSDSTV